MKKICKKCETEKELTEFVKHAKSPGGYRALCKVCKRLESKTHYAANGRKRQPYDSEFEAKYYQENRERIRQTQREYYRNNKHVFKEACMARKAGLKRATPPWADRDALRSIYKNCPKGMHVDHIHPLNGKESCGLHVPWNLQYLTPEQNMKKSNKCQT